MISYRSVALYNINKYDAQKYGSTVFTLEYDRTDIMGLIRTDIS